jgi:hypothetical protein
VNVLSLGERSGNVIGKMLNIVQKGAWETEIKFLVNKL